MQYMGNSDWWDTRFKQRSLIKMGHEKCLEEDLSYFPHKGKVLDLASGDGRNALYLAQLGYDVTAIDFSEEALNRLKYFAIKEGVQVEIHKVDLSKTVVDNGMFDIIIINHYRLNPELYATLLNHMNTQAILWINGFVALPKDNPNITEQDLIDKRDFHMISALDLIDEKSYTINDRMFTRYIYQKK